MGEGRRTVAWTPAAREALEEILDHIALDSQPAAEKILGVILDTAESLSYLATRGRVVPELHQASIREIFVYRHRLIYQVSASEVRILALVHGAMDFEGWLRRNE